MLSHHLLLEKLASWQEEEVEDNRRRNRENNISHMSGYFDFDPLTDQEPDVTTILDQQQPKRARGRPRKQ